jgi:asparagine synthase (glutamine-hydrolysing)
LPRRHRLRLAKRFFEAAELPVARRYTRWVSYFTAAQKQRLYTPEYQKRLAGRDAEAWLSEEFEKSRDGAEPLDALLALDVRSYLPYDLLVKMDIATMACSLEARSPFLDHKVMEFAARLPSDYKIRHGTLKYLLKKAAASLLPPEVLYRRKMGFGVPIGAWLRGELRPLLEDVLLCASARTRAYFDPAALRQLVQAHAAGKQDYSHQLWALLWLELWHREFMP